MARTSLNIRGYGLRKSAFSIDMINDIREELTVSPKITGGIVISPDNIPKYRIYRESEKKLYIPRYFGVNKFGAAEDNRIQEGEDIDITFAGNLRPAQLEPVQAYLRAAHEVGGGLINLQCAAGKTVMTLYIISQLKKKALVIVHKDFLLKQWRERIETFLPGARVGIIKAKELDYFDKDIVIASLQSLSMKDYDYAVFDSFGIVIVDEVHHIASEVFSRALTKINFKYTLGLSATINRKDGLTRVFKWFLGDIVYKGKKRSDGEVDVRQIYYYSPAEEYSGEETLYNGKPNCSRMLNKVAEYKPRIDIIIKSILEIKERESARNILILSGRRKQLSAFHKELKNSGYSIGYYVGGMSQDELKKTEDSCDIILGTYSMASEGMDIPKLDTVIFATPISSIEQSAGRILRKKAEDREYTPLIVDIIDNFSIFRNQAKTREKYYKSRKYNIIKIGDVADDTGSSGEDTHSQSICIIDTD